MRLFLDCDGVLAHFDQRAEEIFGMHPRKFEQVHGDVKFWNTLSMYPNFYRELPLMPEALKLYEAVKHLNPTILTGCPDAWPDSAPQKIEWAARYFPGVPIICCKSAEKVQHMQPGDILIDDYLKYRHLWEAAGGIFILYENADQALAELWTHYPPETEGFGILTEGMAIDVAKNLNIPHCCGMAMYHTQFEKDLEEYRRNYDKETKASNE